MSLNYDKILTRANELYAKSKDYEGFGWTRGSKPTIKSDQVLSILLALVEALNETKQF